VIGWVSAFLFVCTVLFLTLFSFFIYQVQESFFILFSSMEMGKQGLAGAVALKADELRWIPGQKQMRYDIAGFVTILQVLTMFNINLLMHMTVNLAP
jgi:hypothetical protein